MKIFIVVLAVVAVNAQLRSDPFDSFLLKNYNGLQNSQPNFQNYEFFQAPTKNRVIYVPILRNPGPTTISNYKSPDIPIITTGSPTIGPIYNAPYITPQPYSPYETSTTTSRPYIPVVTNQASTQIPPYDFSNTTPLPFRVYQNPRATRRPFFPVVPSSSPSTLTPVIGPEAYISFEALTSTIRPDLDINITPTIGPSHKTLYGSPQRRRPYRILTRRRPFISAVTTSVPNTIPTYNEPTIPIETYRSDNSLITTPRPFIPTVSTPAPTTAPLYDAPVTATRPPYIFTVTTPVPTIVPTYSPTSISSETIKPYETSIITSGPNIPTITTPAPIIVPTYNTLNIASEPLNIYQAPSTIRPPYIPYPTTTPIPYGTPPFVTPPVKYYNGDDGSANTIRSDNEMNRDGSYSWFFETDNGISAQAQGSLKNIEGSPNRVANVVHGAFSWFAPNGDLISVTYTADEFGYHPQTRVIPKSAPITPNLLNSLDYINTVNIGKK